jgi:para-nitrobenzyl esterase
VAGLRALSAAAIVEAEDKLMSEAGFEADLAFAPVKDGVIIPADPLRAFAEGAAAGLPLLNGTTHDEFRYWLLYFPALEYIPTKMALRLAPSVVAKLGDRRDEVLGYYRKKLPRSGSGEVTFAFVNDAMFRVPHLRVSDLQSRHAPVWMYRFDWPSTGSKKLRACHAIELPFVLRTFNAPNQLEIVGPNPPMHLSDLMMDAWIAFIRAGNPNGGARPDWPAYTPDRRATMIFNTDSAVQNDPDQDLLPLYKGIFDDLGGQ